MFSWVRVRRAGFGDFLGQLALQVSASSIVTKPYNMLAQLKVCYAGVLQCFWTPTQTLKLLSSLR